ncbi:DUF1232 domain-containing protein [Streptomyces sp. NPDC059874]|uniref:DUF1232 domain-containing protein n=1 Tax=Streptomyces sp. NPDC059874 TaxID=3346983 RepID=UPI00364939E3
MSNRYLAGHRGWTKLRRRDTSEAVIGAVTGTLARPQLLVLARHDQNGRLRAVGRTVPLRPDAARQVAEHLAAGDCGHPWTGVRFSASRGRVTPRPPAEGSVRVWWDILIRVGAGLLFAWLALLVALLLIRPKGALLGEAIRLLPDLLRLLKRLAGDKTMPRGVRVRLWLLMVYLASPIDLIPDFLPIIGYADDAIVVAFVLRSVVGRAGIEAVRAHWPGTEDGVDALPAWPDSPAQTARRSSANLAASHPPVAARAVR